MNKSELIDAIVTGSNNELTKKNAEVALNAAIDAIKGALKAGDKVQLIGFGTFAVKERAARTGKNPRTGAQIEIGACKIPTFTAGKALKDEIQ